MNEIHIGLFELTRAMVYPDGTDAAEPDVPYAPGAKAVWLNHQANRYGGIELSAGRTLYHPTAFRDARGLPLGTPTFCRGLRVYAWYNVQSGRWEILAPALNLIRIELTEDLVPGQDRVAAALPDSDDRPRITVYLPPAPQYFGLGRGRTETVAGTLGFALWNPARGRWEMLGGQFKLTCEAKADRAIPPGSSGPVSLWWRDDAAGELVDSGQNVMATNWLHPQILRGDKLIVSFDRQENRWMVTGAE